MNRCPTTVAPAPGPRIRRRHVAALVILAVLGLSVPVAVGQVGDSGRGERIAFVSDRDGSHEVYAMDADGDNVDQLTQGADASEVAFSPDGTLLAFSSQLDGGNIFIVQADGLGLRALTTNGARNESPAFSPDGTTIAFSAQVGGNTDIYTMDLFGQNVRRLTVDGAFDGFPSFSPDGSTIVFSSKRAGTHDIWTMAAAGTGQARLAINPNEEVDPVFSPDGTEIAFTNAAPSGVLMNVSIMNRDGTGSRPLVPGQRFDRAPTFAPDGTILFQASDNGDDSGGTSLARINRDGTGLRVLSDTSANEFQPSAAITDVDVEPELVVIEEVRAARDAVIAHIDEAAAGINSHTDQVGTTVNAHTDEVTAGIASSLGELASHVGNHTWAMCVNGSTRKVGNTGFQTYLNLVSPTSQLIQVRYLTNKGIHIQQLAVQANTPKKIDVNLVLTGVGGPFAGQRDVDVAMDVTAFEPIFVGCPVYFDTTVGAAGRVAGGFDQHVFTN